MTEVRGMASGRGEAKEMGRKSTPARPRPEHQSGLRRTVNSAVYVERWCVLVSKLREIVGLDSLAEGALLAFSQWEVQRSRLPLESVPRGALASAPTGYLLRCIFCLRQLRGGLTSDGIWSLFFTICISPAGAAPELWLHAVLPADGRREGNRGRGVVYLFVLNPTLL